LGSESDLQSRSRNGRQGELRINNGRKPTPKDDGIEKLIADIATITKATADLDKRMSRLEGEPPSVEKKEDTDSLKYAAAASITNELWETYDEIVKR
jgi:hypothetical protein